LCAYDTHVTLAPRETDINALLALVQDLATIIGSLAGITASGAMKPGCKGPSGAITDLVAENHGLVMEVKIGGAVNGNEEDNQFRRTARDFPGVPYVLLLLVERDVPEAAKDVGAIVVYGRDLADRLEQTHPELASLLKRVWYRAAPSYAPVPATSFTGDHYREVREMILATGRRSGDAQRALIEDLRSQAPAWEFEALGGRCGGLGWRATLRGLNGEAVFDLQFGARGSNMPTSLWCNNHAALAECGCEAWPKHIVGIVGGDLEWTGHSPYDGQVLAHSEYRLNASSTPPIPASPTGAQSRADAARWIAGLLNSLASLADAR